MDAPTTHEELAARVAEHFAETPAPPLIIHGLTENLYRAYPAVNVSSLKPLIESPRKYRWAKDHPKAITAAMIFGTCVHAILLEPDRLANLVVTRPEQWADWRTKAAKEWRDGQTALVASAEELEEMRACADSVQADPKAGWILSHAQREVAVFRRHERTGLLLKARLDLPFLDLEERIAVADIKKVQSVQPSLFAKAVGNFYYHLQGAFYVDMIGASDFYFIAVEEEAPNEVRLFKLSRESLQRGRTLYESLLDRLAQCLSDGRWPGASEDSDEVPEIEEPAWCRELKIA